jgi:hypothetical protein
VPVARTASSVRHRHRPAETVVTLTAPPNGIIEHIDANSAAPGPFYHRRALRIEQMAYKKTSQLNIRCPFLQNFPVYEVCKRQTLESSSPAHSLGGWLLRRQLVSL